MSERRLTKSERRLQRAVVEEPEQGPRGILELFHEREPDERDEDAPLRREGDESSA